MYPFQIKHYMFSFRILLYINLELFPMWVRSTVYIYRAVIDIHFFFDSITDILLFDANYFD